MTDTKRNASELLFEEYLAGHEWKWAYEIAIDGKRRTPDYRVEHGGCSHFLEVKEFDAPLPLPGFGTYDPYGPIRQKINQAARQFKEYKEYPCSLVLANPNCALVRLADPWAILGSMLGDLGFTVQLGAGTSTQPASTHVFLGGGKMIDQKHGAPQNTTVSSVVVLGTYPLWQHRVQVAIRERQRELGRPTTLEEELPYYSSDADAPEFRRVRVIVYENPFARIPINRELFRGPFDELWGLDGQVIKRVYIGPQAARIEEDLRESGS